MTSYIENEIRQKDICQNDGDVRDHSVEVDL